MQPGESRQIEFLRVLCITAMMWVHVNPGLSTPTIVSAGEYHLVGTIFGNTLGRISVSLLSFVSGYLIWETLRHESLGHLALRRFRTVIVPMLVWSAVFLVLALAKEWITGEGANAVAEVELRLWPLIDAWSGLTGPTANRSLFFLRDLFVATLILRAAVPLIERVPAVAALAILIVASNDALAPVIYRSSILQFLFFGAIAARLGYTIAGLSRPLVALSLGYLMTVAGFAAIADPGMTAIWEQALDLIEAGQMTLDTFIAKQSAWVAQLVQQHRGATLSIALPPSPPCPRCGAPMRQRTGKSGAFWSCSRHPDCKGALPVESSASKRGAPRKRRAVPKAS
jgi:hypothetical protein